VLAGDIKCPICGSKTSLRTSKKDGSKFHVCVNWPDCKGKVAYDEDWDDEWEEERPAKAGKRYLQETLDSNEVLAIRFDMKNARRSAFLTFVLGLFFSTAFICVCYYMVDMAETDVDLFITLTIILGVLVLASAVAYLVSVLMISKYKRKLIRLVGSPK
jgi:hypothetical protein